MARLRPMALAVIGTGFGRTGTLSLKHALEDLGFGPSYHMQEVLKRPAHIRAWQRFATTGEADWEDLFTGFASGVDFPVSCAWRELVAHDPDARVVHTVRDPAAWWTSTESTIYRARSMFPAWLPPLLPPAARYLDMADRLVWDGIFDGRFLDRDHAIAVFERHTEEVRREVPADRLLVFEVAQGWEPLCAHLGVPVPDHPFPRLNDAASMRRTIGTVRVATRAAPVVAAGIAGAATARRVRRRARRRSEASGPAEISRRA